MSDATGPGHVSQHHRATLEHIEHHPTTHNLEWDDVIGLLNEVADVREEHDGKFVVKLGDDRITITKPRHKNVDEQLVLDLRKLFKDAGYLPTKK
ncbi:hypothetical protein ACFSBZ_04865 [Amnibacterium flavum]|uniref:HicA protein n=1 Tax=Amnibacterium flavum TaxID=2173173 RepID=A0A2V1HV45_9MICO|nr:hypothetical protein [Amnibacterium flavum]PVZ94187.1 hypothetical protein DDQ50_10610 [Amnibacterium flavum]